MIDVELRNVVKQFSDFAAVKGVSLEVRAGELLTLLGPSGCGKTTLLRMITGFLEPDEGEVVIRGRVVNDLPPDRRDTAMVYQSYALFPHMSVLENVAFGLRMRKVPGPEIARRVGEALELVHLGGLARRYPTQLSGGQQQRVALARALVVRPSVLLLDEPLSNLDAKLREEMRTEIRQLQQELGTTTIFVTHDQAEALTMSDRIAVMNHGQVEQIGTPAGIYERPTTRFVADFIGRANLLEGEVASVVDGLAHVRLSDTLMLQVPNSLNRLPGERIAIGIRPERIEINPEGSDLTAPNTFAGTVDQVMYLGQSLQYRVRLSPNVALTVLEQNRTAGTIGPQTRVCVAFEPRACIGLRE